jgi:hypothetical protein
MAASGRTRAFTLADVLVVSFLCLFLMLVTPLMFYRTRSDGSRMTCGSNLSGIGKAMSIYANDYEDQLPRAGGRTTQWGATASWKAPDRRTAFGVQADGSGGTASISSCFYLLVKYSEVTPERFLCKGDKGVTEFKLSGRRDVPRNFELIDAWDFGPPEESYTHYSYSYHIPFGLYALTTSNEPGFGCMTVYAVSRRRFRPTARPRGRWA